MYKELQNKTLKISAEGEKLLKRGQKRDIIKDQIEILDQRITGMKKKKKEQMSQVKAQKKLKGKGVHMSTGEKKLPRMCHGKVSKENVKTESEIGKAR